MLSVKLRSISESERGGIAVKGVFFLLFVSVVGLSVFYFLFGTVVPPGNFGVRQTTMGPWKGFSEKGLPPGYHLTVPGFFGIVPRYTVVHVVPENVQIFDFHRDRTKYLDSPGALYVPTIDGAVVDVDISVLYRFYSHGNEERGGPADLITRVGRTTEAWQNHIRTIAEDELRRALGKLDSGQFYDPHLREKQVRIAQEGMNESLADYGIGVDSVLLRRYTYQAERIDRAIFEKNLQDQEERLNAASSRFAKAKAQLEGVSAEWDAKIKTLLVEGENRVRVVESEGDLYEKEKVAGGDLLVAKATAEVDRLRAGALANSKGADIFVARELAPLLSSLKGGVVSDLDPYDLDSWMDRLGIPAEVTR